MTNNPTIDGVSRPDACAMIQALLNLDARGSLVPHGIGGLARDVLTKAQSTIAQLQARVAELESGRGEPVAKCFERRNGAGEWVNDSKTWADGMPCAGILNECEKYPDLYRIRLAYAAPPAQVAVVLPELESAFEKWWEEDGQYCRAGGGSYEKTFAYRAYEACLDATAALNNKP